MKNNEKDLKIQVPTQAWLTMNIVMGMDSALKQNSEISLKDYVEQQKLKTNVWEDNPSMHIYNLGTVMMMSYAFLVVPKESIEQNKIDVSSKEIKNILNKMKITENKELENIEKNQNIIRHIRNSIAHANFKIIPEDDEIIFIDKNRGKKTFEGSIKINDFVSFLSNYFKSYYASYHKTFIQNSNK